MKKIFLLSTLWVILFSCHKNNDSAGGKILLRLQPKVGEQVKMKVQNQFQINDSQQNVKGEMDFYFHMKVKEQNDSAGLYSLDMQRVAMTTWLNGIKVAYDSEKKDNGLMGETIGKEILPLLGRKVEMRLTHQGVLKDLDLNNNTSLYAQTLPNFGGISIYLPTDSVKVGDSWAQSMNYNEWMQGGTQKDEENQIVFTLDKITENQAFISLQSAFNEDKSITNSKIKGSYILDRKTGLTQKGEVKITVSGTDTQSEIQLIYEQLQ